jgi:hypothetical protein
MPLRGTENTARRVVHDIRILSRVIQPRAGYRENHGQPVPIDLAEQARRGSRKQGKQVNARCDVSRAGEYAGHEKGRL